MKILCICTGNMNRSPAAHYLAAKKLQNTEHKVDSAGTSKKAVNKPMAKKTRIAMQDYGFNFGVNDHRSKPLTRELLDWADKVIYMVPGHKASILEEFPDSENKLISMASFSRGQYDHIEDPAWTQGIEIAKVVLKQINECLENMITDWNLRSSQR